MKLILENICQLHEQIIKKFEEISIDPNAPSSTISMCLFASIIEYIDEVIILLNKNKSKALPIILRQIL